MIYEWKCMGCDKVIEVKASVEDRDTPPVIAHICGNLEPGVRYEWKRIISKSSTPFQHLKQSGVFADDNGNFAPRKV
jgi:hypothetical protein